MTLLDAQARLATAVLRIAPGLSVDDLGYIQRDLKNLILQMPTDPEFDSVRAVIHEVRPVLLSGITLGTIASLASRDDVITSVTEFLTQSAAATEAKAKGLALSQPKEIVDAVKNAASTVQEIRTAATAGDFTGALQKAQGLQAALVKVQAAISG